MRASFIGLLLMAAACAAGSVDSVPVDGRSEGCGDAFLYRISADNGTVLVLRWDGAATGTWELNDTSKTMIGRVGDEGIDVSMEVGQNLGQLVCNDVVEKEPVVERVYAGISGSVELTLTSVEGADPSFPTAEARITDLVLQGEDGTVIEVDEVVFGPAPVGWYAG